MNIEDFIKQVESFKSSGTRRPNSRQSWECLIDSVRLDLELDGIGYVWLIQDIFDDLKEAYRLDPHYVIENIGRYEYRRKDGIILFMLPENSMNLIKVTNKCFFDE